MVLLCNQSLDGGIAVDALLDGLDDAAARGLWHPDPDSEARRLALLPQTAPLPWDELMHQPAFQHALERNGCLEALASTAARSQPSSQRMATRRRPARRPLASFQANRSMCSQGMSAGTKSSRNSAALMAPACGPRPVLTMSAISLSMPPW